uniref:HAT C-terminal dimerisation domain-containing protein n=1 Tax=Romanomermis culicivorax TaxID=13658 RepID=A0A915KTU3_ROMCU
MFTSDGASVMLGRRQGVAERLRSNYGYTHLLDFHCVCHRENLALKDAFEFTYVKASTSAGENWKDTLKKCVNDPEVFPNLSQLAAAVLCFNAQNATVERGFSLLSRIKTKLRNRLSVPVIDMLLRLRLSTVNYQDFDFHQAFQYYVKKRTYSLGIKQKHKQNLEDADKDAGYNCFTDLPEIRPSTKKALESLYNRDSMTADFEDELNYYNNDYKWSKNIDVTNI